MNRYPRLPGTPWFLQGLGASAAPGAGPGEQVSQALPTVELPLIPRVPDPNDQQYQRRMAGFTERVAAMLNSLIFQRVIRLTGARQYTLIGGSLIADRPPTANDDSSTGAFAGCSWVDRSAKKIWHCVDAGIGAAIWNGPY